jgi:RNA polymerase sigma-70 factor, ECF subfamily
MLFGLFSRKHIRNLNDADLIKLAGDKDTIALGELFQRYSPLVMGLCLKYMKDIPSAEDIMMELFEKLPEKLSKAEIQNFKSWLYSVSRNECLMALRKKKIDVGDIEMVELFVENESEKLLQEALTKENKLVTLESALLALKDDQRKCIDLFYLKKKSYDLITLETGYTLKEVKSHIQNGKRNLKLLLEQPSGN